MLPPVPGMRSSRSLYPAIWQVMEKSMIILTGTMAAIEDGSTLVHRANFL